MVACKRSYRTGVVRMKIRAALIALTLAWGTLLCAPLVVSAHVGLVAATPVAGSTIGQAPKAVKIRFDQVPDPQFNRIELLDISGKTVAGGAAQRDAVDPTIVTTTLPPLPAGVYTVAWQALASDGHLTKGNYSFTFAATGPPAPAVPQAVGVQDQGAPSAGSATIGNPSALSVLVRWLRYGALGLLVGAFALVTLVLRPLCVARAQDAEDGDALWRRVTRLVAPLAFAGGVAFLLTHVLTLIVQAVTLTDTGLTGVQWDTVRRVLTDTEYGAVWRLTAIVAIIALIVMVTGFPSEKRGEDRAALGIIAAPARRSPAPVSPLSEVVGPPPAFWPWPVGLAVSLVLVGTLTLSSHAVESQHEPLLALIADGVHLGAMGIWFGGLLVLLVTLPRLLPTLPAGERNTVRAGIIARFSPVGLWGIAAMIVTGVYAMTLHLTRETITTTNYGRTLLLKHALIVPLIAAAALNLLIVRPGLVRGDARSVRWLPRLLFIEAALGVVVLLVTATLTQLPPAHPLIGTNAAAADPRLSAALRSASPIAVVLGPNADLSSGPQSAAMVHDAQVMAVLQITSGKDGGSLSANLIDAKTVPAHEDENGVSLGVAPTNTPLDPKQLDDVQRVTALITFTGLDLGQTSVDFTRDTDDWWRAKGQLFPIKGVWNIQLVVRRANVAEDARLNFDFTSDPARFAGASPALAPATSTSTSTAPTASTSLRWPRLLPNGYLGLAVALIGVVLFALTFGTRFRGTVSGRTIRLYRTWSLGALIVGVVMLGYFSADLTPTSDVKNPLPNDTATLALGQQVYAQNCAVCHGPRGAGNGPLAANLNPPPVTLQGGHLAAHTDGDMHYWIANGIPGTAMPAFSGSLSDGDIWAAIRYVRTLSEG